MKALLFLPLPNDTKEHCKRTGKHWVFVKDLGITRSDRKLEVGIVMKSATAIARAGVGVAGVGGDADACQALQVAVVAAMPRKCTLIDE